MGSKLTTKQFAKLANITYGRVCQLIWEGKIKAKKYGRDWLIEKDEFRKWQKNLTTSENPENISAKP